MYLVQSINNELFLIIILLQNETRDTRYLKKKQKILDVVLYHVLGPWIREKKISFFDLHMKTFVWKQ